MPLLTSPCPTLCVCLSTRQESLLAVALEMNQAIIALFHSRHFLGWPDRLYKSPRGIYKVIEGKMTFLQ